MNRPKRTSAVARREVETSHPPVSLGRGCARPIIVDSREKLPFRFRGYTVKTAALTTGDYSVEGYENLVAVERKSGADLVSCLTTQRKRFERELHRSLNMTAFAVVIEDPLSALHFIAHARTSTPFSALISRIGRLAMQYRVPFMFCETRETAQAMTLEMLRPFLK